MMLSSNPVAVELGASSAKRNGSIGSVLPDGGCLRGRSRVFGRPVDSKGSLGHPEVARETIDRSGKPVERGEFTASRAGFVRPAHGKK